MALLKIGDRLDGEYEVQQVLPGGMGVVYIVRSLRFDRTLAVKTFVSEVFEAHQAIADRFNQEARIWVDLGAHPNIVFASMVHEIDRQPYLFLEYVSDGDLSLWIGQPRLTLEQTIHFGLHFCDGMNHAVRKGLHVHRDIKPRNCMITARGILKVTDFGLARAIGYGDETPSVETGPGGPHRHSLTRAGAVAGTRAYMAPEQYEDMKSVDLRADVYSFGVMLFEMLSGDVPFKARDWLDYARAHKEERVPPLPRSIPRDLVELVNRCLEKDRNNRFNNFIEVREQLGLIFERLTGKALRVPALRPVDDSFAVLDARCASLAALGQFDAALEAGLRAVDINPLDASTWGVLGWIHAECERFRESGAAYDRALELEPLAPIYWEGKARSLAGLGKMEEALAAQDRAIQLDPQSQMAWHGRGVSLEILGRRDEAIASFDRALVLDPKDSAAWVKRGTCLESLDRLDDALESYRRATEANPHNWLAWKFRSLLASRLPNPGEGGLAAAQAASIRHTARDHDKLGVVLSGLGHSGEAINSFDKAIELDPTYAKAWLHKGVELGQRSQFDNALPCFQRALELSPTNGEAWRNLGLTFALTKRHVEALDAFGRGADFSDALASCFAAELLCELGRYGEAEDAAARAVQLDPLSHRSHLALGLSLMRLDRPADALQSLEKARDLGNTQAPGLIAAALMRIRYAPYKGFAP